MRIAFFTPLPPTPSGIAAYSRELLPLLRQQHDIDVFVDRPISGGEPSVHSAHDFVWRHRRQPYDLTVYQLGNATCHDYMWGYLFRYPGMVVLHDGQLHQARALALTKRWIPRKQDYLAELRANHPDAPADLGELIAAGMGGSLFAFWPLVRLVIESSRLTVVHNARLATELADRHPTAAIEAIDMGVRDATPDRPEAGATIRERHGIPADAVVVAAFGGITPEKRIPELLRAANALAHTHPQLHVMLVGASLEHFDVDAETSTHAAHLASRVHRTGFVSDEELGAYLAAADICSCMRWPSNRETSASWLRCLCAGRPTIVTDLTHMTDVPTLDPRSWRVIDAGPPSPKTSAGRASRRPPVAVSIDILDEDHMLRLALDRLVTDRPLRETLGRHARHWWAARHQLDDMARAYERVLAMANERPAGTIPLPAHLTEDGTTHARQLLGQTGVDVDFL